MNNQIKAVADREAFESFPRFEYMDFTLEKDSWGRDKYIHSHIQALFDGWQAAIECITSMGDVPPEISSGEPTAAVASPANQQDELSLVKKLEALKSETPDYDEPRKWNEAVSACMTVARKHIAHPSPATITVLKQAAEALEYYANPSDYKAPNTGGMGKLFFDCGNEAKSALSAITEELKRLGEV